MTKALPLHRLITLGVSCLIHVGLVGGAVAIGRDLAKPKAPSVVIAELVPAEPPRRVEPPRPVAAKPATPKPALPKPENLTLPKPIATPIPPPLVEPKTVETPAPPPPAVPTEPSAPMREPRLVSGPSTSFERAGAFPMHEAPVSESGRGRETPTPQPPATAMAIPGDGITQTAIPRGGYQVRPSYPSSARRLGIHGTTTLRIYVAADGRVAEVVVQQSAGHPDLDEAAAGAVKRWRFEPARRGTEASACGCCSPSNFNSNRSGAASSRLGAPSPR